MKKERIIDIRYSLNKIDNGEWVARPRGWVDKTYDICIGEEDDGAYRHHNENNAQFIANAPEFVKELLQEVHNIKTSLEAIREYCMSTAAISSGDSIRVCEFISYPYKAQIFLDELKRKDKERRGY